MAERRHNVTCKICGKRFLASGKTHPMGRLAKHRAKEHPTQHKKSMKKGASKRKEKLTDELQLTDDILYRQIMKLKDQYSPRQPYQPEHNVTIGALIEGVMLGIEIAKTIKERRKR